MKPKVLFGVLDWGLGHATRSIPIIKYLIDNNFEVHVCSDGSSLSYLKHEFPSLDFYELPSYNVKYPFNSIFFNIALSSAGIVSALINEKLLMKKLIKRVQPDIIISDNRYGFRSKSIKSIIITHQINLQLSNLLLSYLGSFVIGLFLDKFDEVWVPDFENNLLAGKLSKCNSKISCKYIGPISRFVYENNKTVYKTAVIISGPEPQRTKFEKQILKQFENYKDKTIIILGNLKTNKTYYLNNNVRVKSHVFSEELNEIINKSEIIISRSGYSSIMDYVILGKNALLIPTPGQSEQEYLAKYLKDKKIFYSVNQNDFNIELDLGQIKDYSLKQEKNSFIDFGQLIKNYFE